MPAHSVSDQKSYMAADPRPRTAVLMQHTGIGDFVWHVQYFKAIAAQSQAGKVTVIAQPSTLARAFIGSEPWVDAIIDHDHRPRRGDGRRGKHAGLTGMRRMAVELQALKLDRLVMFSGRASRGLIAGLSGIPTRLGYGYNRLQRLFLSQGPYIEAHQGPSVPVYHEASTFAMAHHFCTQPITPALDVPETMLKAMQVRIAAMPRPISSLAIGTSEPHKQWGAGNYARLAQALADRGGSVILLGGPGEQALAQEILQQVPIESRSRVHVITNAPVLGSAALLKLSDVCVGNDTGMVNVAAAVSCPTWVLLGNRRPLKHDPQHLHNVLAPALEAITVQQIISALEGA
jgi:heptosyltransferase-2